MRQALLHPPATPQQRFAEWQRHLRDATLEVLELDESAPPVLEILRTLPPHPCNDHGCFCAWQCEPTVISALRYLASLGERWALCALPELHELVPDLGDVLIDFGAGPCASTVGAALLRPLPTTIALEIVEPWRQVGAAFARGLGIDVVERMSTLEAAERATLQVVQVLNTRPGVHAFTEILACLPRVRELTVIELSDVDDRGRWATDSGRDQLSSALREAEFVQNSTVATTEFGRHEGRVWRVAR